MAIPPTYVKQSVLNPILETKKIDFSGLHGVFVKRTFPKFAQKTSVELDQNLLRLSYALFCWVEPLAHLITTQQKRLSALPKIKKMQLGALVSAGITAFGLLNFHSAKQNTPVPNAALPNTASAKAPVIVSQFSAEKVLELATADMLPATVRADTPKYTIFESRVFGQKVFVDKIKHPDQGQVTQHVYRVDEKGKLVYQNGDYFRVMKNGKADFTHKIKLGANINQPTTRAAQFSIGFSHGLKNIFTRKLPQPFV